MDEAIRKTEEIIAKLKQLKQGLLHDLLTRGIDDNGELRDPERHPEQFKDSALGRIPKGWEVATAGSLCSLITKGTTPSRSEMWTGTDGIRFLRVDNLTMSGELDLAASAFRISFRTHSRSLARSRVLPGDVLTNIVGPPLGKLARATEALGDANINQAIALFRPTEQFSSEYLLLWLAGSPSQRWFRNRAKQTSGQVNLTLAMCSELPVVVPSLLEQRKIIELVSTHGERLQAELDMSAKLGAIKRGLMDDLLSGRVRVTAMCERNPAQERTVSSASTEEANPARARFDVRADIQGKDLQTEGHI